MSACWIAVASADHVQRGRQGGFMQVNHGKAAPLHRVRPGDGIVYYSPTTVLGEKDGLQAFTAIGTVREGHPYQGDMGGGFTPLRRDVDWAQAEEAPIKPLLARLEFTNGKSYWGYRLRFGLFPISAADFGLIAKAMSAKLASTTACRGE
ncbi:EVE domain-containing protein [Mesorhizobium sp. B2-3-13]|uniref:EVE domain-containing protein n=1 Tax=Mesorhizobium sp. B2-3-13 TaxID=2589951 RepID=UPI00112AAB74|nr:EVE domain-containing protein [Mesorhizobium sp. B2-3-13]TPL89806.1 EVE domain-containing protein [Mesorhizobium sp. B2-3-13]